MFLELFQVVLKTSFLKCYQIQIREFKSMFFLGEFLHCVEFFFPSQNLANKKKKKKEL
jgi:hypothetical protein